MYKAVFIDRDGTVNEEMGYINHPDRLKIFPEALEAIKILNQLEYKAILVSNQAGLARGYFNEQVLFETHMKMKTAFSDQGAFFDLTIYCPFLPGAAVKKYDMDHPCRKPQTGMIDTAAKIFDLDLDNSYIIGDRHKDMDFGRRAGLTPLLVRTGYGKGEELMGGFPEASSPHMTFDNILEAVLWIKGL
ncbi:HAD family hydrolase [Candidatus Calescamantes bacterium]|nr:HAD family hydrolase [Candidatus Calescamantes bacterium]